MHWLLGNLLIVKLLLQNIRCSFPGKVPLEDVFQLFIRTMRQGGVVVSTKALIS